MSSSSSETLEFLSQLPFSLNLSDGLIVDYLNFSHHYHQLNISPIIDISLNLYHFRQLPFSRVDRPIPITLSQPRNQYSFRSQDIQSPDTPDSTTSTNLGSTLSPTLPPLLPIDPFKYLFLESLNNLQINHPSRDEIQSCLDSFVNLFTTLSRDLLRERDQGIRAISALTTDALRTVERQLLPEIERLEELLRRLD